MNIDSLMLEVSFYDVWDQICWQICGICVCFSIFLNGDNSYIQPWSRWQRQRWHQKRWQRQLFWYMLGFVNNHDFDAALDGFVPRVSLMSQVDFMSRIGFMLGVSFTPCLAFDLFVLI